MQAYKYKPISHNCIRLLKLLPGEPAADLEANLEVRTIRSTSGSQADGEVHPYPEEYEALSYHWGFQDDVTKTIKILSQSRSFYIGIKPNLDAALRQLRHPLEPRSMWIDALCINQEDSDEKTTQVLLMSRIYSSAKAVAVWLGVEAGGSHRAIQFMHRCLDLDDLDSLVRDSVTSEDWAALSELMRRPWFSRRSVSHPSLVDESDSTG